MFARTSHFALSLLAPFALVFAACADEAPGEGGVDEAPSAELAATARTSSVPYNRSIKQVVVSVDPATGQARAEVNYGLDIDDESEDVLDLTSDIVISVNGRAVDRLRGPEVVKKGAITCASTCSGACPSLFGNGVCRDCRCDYNNWFSSAFGGSPAPRPGDVVSARVVPSGAGVPELDVGDDVARVVVR